MSVLDIIVEPNKELHQTSREVSDEEINDDLRSLLSDMAETMYATRGVGLAAPQIGDFRRILVADIGYAKAIGTDNSAGKYGTELIKMINPKVLSSDGIMKGVEGCLSVPGFEYSVERNSSIVVQFLNEFGEQQEEVFENYSAVIIQHEIDHLNGVTLLTRAGKLKRSRYLKKLKDDKKNRKTLGQ